MAERLGAAVVGITHFAKGTTGRKTTERIIGSVAYSAISRVSMVTVMDKDGGGRLVRSKSNIGPQGDGFAYSIKVVERQYDGKDAKVSLIEWGGPLYGRADELLDQVEGKRLPRDEAVEWLAATLAGGPMPSKMLKAKAVEDGIAWRTVERAKDHLGVIAGRAAAKGQGRGKGEWEWGS